MAWNKGKGAIVIWLREHAAHEGDNCLIYPFRRIHTGYGQFSFEGRLHYANRFMCELAHGPAPTPDHQSAHSCGNGDEGCVHPGHLSWKTRSENQLDRREHGTTKQGRRFKLTPEQVAEIRSLKGQKTQTEIAGMFGVTRENIWFIQSGRSWRTGKRETGGFTVKSHVSCKQGLKP
jgi:hypothetical protein